MYDILAQVRIQRFVQSLVDLRQYPESFRMINRYPVVDAMDGEIFARFKGRVIAADLIGLTDKAPARSAPEISLEQTNLPVIKHFRPLTREQLRMLNRIESNAMGATDRGDLLAAIGTDTGTLVKGVWSRMNWMMYQMLRDSLAWNKNGIIFNATFGMPSDLKLTNTSTAKWSAASTATPIADIQGLQQTGRVKYGVDYNRVTLSQTAFNYMIRTTEFQNLAQALYLTQGVTISLPYNNVPRMTELAQNVAGVTFEIDDTQLFDEENDGSIVSTRNFPVNEVLLTASADDGDAGIMDFANAQLEEAMPGMIPSLIGAMTGGPYGPIGYVTAADAQGNPPGINLWACGSGFPRKHMEAHSALITAY